MRGIRIIMLRKVWYWLFMEVEDAMMRKGRVEGIVQRARRVITFRKALRHMSHSDTHIRHEWLFTCRKPLAQHRSSALFLSTITAGNGRLSVRDPGKTGVRRPVAS